MQASQYNLQETLTTMDIIKKHCFLFLAVLCIFLLFVGCERADNEEVSDIIYYDSGIQIFFDDTSSGKLEREEIFLSEDEIKSLIDSLATYNGELSDDTLKKEFLLWYTIKLNNETTLQIDAELDYSGGSDLTYMYVIRHNTEPATLYGTFINSSIVEQLKRE